MKAQWTDEVFNEMSAEYLERMEALDEADRPKHSSEVVAELAEKFGFAVNAFRMKLSKAGVYIKKEPGAKSTSTATGEAKTSTRVSKADAHAEVVAAFTDGGVAVADIDMSIIEKLTGKAAAHIAVLIRQITK